MKRINCDYIIDNKKTIKTGHINYTLSHFIKSFFKYNINRINSSNNLTAKHIYNRLSYCFNNQTGIYCAFLVGGKSIQNISSKSMFTFLHCIGYYIFEKEISINPKFSKINNHIVLADNNGNVMTFGVSDHISKNIKCKKQYHARFILDDVNKSIFVNNHCDIKILDPVFDNFKGSYNDNYEKVLNVFFENALTKEIVIKNKYFSFVICISKKPTDEYLKSINSYYDGQLYFYVKNSFKLSNYILFIDKTNIIFSLLSSSLIKLNKEKYINLKKGNFKNFNKEELDKLQDMSFVHLFNNEYDFYKNSFSKFKKSERIGLTLLTNTMCNARCAYCYQKNAKKQTTTANSQKQIMKFICNKNPSKLHITWFGGEPLLNVDYIDNITKFCESKKIDYYSTIITNGFLVNKFIAKFKKWKIKNVQITLDGTENKYNLIKNFSTKENAFLRVINNIKLLLDNNIGVSIRFNFDRNNYKDILDCIAYLYDTFGNHALLKIYANHIYGPVENYTLDEGTNLYLLIYKKLIDYGYVKKISDLRISYKSFSCFRNNKNHYVINCDGKLYNCEHGILNNEMCSYGDVNSGVKNIKIYNYWIKKDMPYKKCKLCKFLFLCQGGCKYERFENKYKYVSCVWYKNILDILINYLYNKSYGNY